MDSEGLVAQLISAFQCLPGVGPKSAQRMVFQLLQKNRQRGQHLAEVMLKAIEQVGQCQRCRTLTEQSVCSICANPRRDQSVLCVVESAADVFAIDQAIGYEGMYFVLHGRLSPLDGIGPEDLGFSLLDSLLSAGHLSELILATNTTVEGEVTAQYIAEMAIPNGIKVTRIAHGVPVGGELEYVDRGTLAHAFAGRKQL